MKPTAEANAAAIHNDDRNQPPGDGKPAKPKRGPDPELQAMARLDRIIAELNPDQTRRVVAWLRDKHSGYETRTPEYIAP